MLGSDSSMLSKQRDLKSEVCTLGNIPFWFYENWREIFFCVVKLCVTIKIQVSLLHIGDTI